MVQNNINVQKMHGYIKIKAALNVGTIISVWPLHVSVLSFINPKNFKFGSTEN